MISQEKLLSVVQAPGRASDADLKEAIAFYEHCVAIDAVWGAAHGPAFHGTPHAMIDTLSRALEINRQRR